MRLQTQASIGARLNIYFTIITTTTMVVHQPERASDGIGLEEHFRITLEYHIKMLLILPHCSLHANFIKPTIKEKAR